MPSSILYGLLNQANNLERLTRFTLDTCLDTHRSDKTSTYFLSGGPCHMSSSSLAAMHFIVSTDKSKADPKTRKLIRSHVMLGKNQGKPRSAKRRRATSKAIVAEQSAIPRATLHPAIETYYSTIPRRVGSDLSFLNAATEIQPAVFENIMQCQLLSGTHVL